MSDLESLAILSVEGCCLELVCCYGMFVVLVCTRVGRALCLWSCLVLVLVLLQRASAQAGATSRPTKVSLARAKYLINFLPSSFLTTLTLPVCRLRCSRPQLSP